MVLILFMALKGDTKFENRYSLVLNISYFAYGISIAQDVTQLRLIHFMNKVMVYWYMISSWIFLSFFMLNYCIIIYFNADE